LTGAVIRRNVLSMAIPPFLAFDVAPYPDPIEIGESAVAATPAWLWLAGGSCCVLAAVIGVLAVVVLGWILMRRRNK
jgi:hypothetical protein